MARKREWPLHTGPPYCEDGPAHDTDHRDAVVVKAIVCVFKAWRVSASDAARLAGVSERTWSRIKGEDWSGSLTDDQLTRASAVIGLYKALHLYFSDDLADRWPKMRNLGPLFQGATPVAFMAEGGLPAMLDARGYIDAVRGGV